MSEQIEVKHTGGVGAFFYAAIPALLAGALLMYFAFYTGIIDWQKAQRVEGRMDNRVGVHGELRAPVDLIIRKADCLEVTRAFLDGDTGTMYIKNDCHRHLSYMEWHWNIIAPDGTIIKDNYSNDLNVPLDGETVEKNFNLDDDSRAAKIVVWAQTNQ